MAHRALGILVVCVVMALCVTASASNYYLTDLGRFETGQVVKFRDAGVQTTEQVLEASLTPKARKLLATKVGLSEAEVLGLARDCELMQINGVGPKAAGLLRAAGVKHVKDLAGRKADKLLPLLTEANKQQGLTETNPSLDLVQYWIEEAKRVPYHLK
jgi:predicted flap endonuclease-1-like 5' DNA nuclease